MMVNLKIICDPEDFARIHSITWTLDEDGRLRAGIDGKTVRLQQFVLPGHDLVDHVNGNQFDVRKDNLRPATVSQNGYNRGKTLANTSGYKGVFRRKDLTTRPWLAKIVVEKKQINLGRFADKIDAAKCYDVAAIKYHGEFAVTNFPRSDYD